MTSTIGEPVAGQQSRAAQLSRPSRLSRTSPERRPGRDKLKVPRLNVPLLPRHRVTSLIQCAAARRVTVVCGPTGSGKTVACAQWASGRPVAWVSLDPGDRRPARLWTHVSGALAALPDAQDLAAELPAADESGYPLQLAQVAERLPVPVTLVIDDVQELAGSAAQAELELLIRHGPPTLRLLLAGRHLGGLSVARLRVGGDLAEIGPADLACTAEESRDYFAMLGVELPAEQLDELLRRTQGWITGLRLAALRPESGPAKTTPWRIAGDEPQVADYLRDEVLATQPADRRDFLLRTCLVDRICGDLADTLTGSDGGSAMLDRLYAENVMIRPSPPAELAGAAEPGGVEYRYHPLLLDLLRAQLRRELPGEVRLLAKRAASWQAANGQYAEALSSAADSGDWDFAVDVLARTGPELLLPGPACALEPVLASFPASHVTSEAAVAGALAAASLRTGDSCAARIHLDNAESAVERCPAEQRLTVTTWLRALAVMQATAAGQARPATQEAAALASEAGATARDAAGHQAAGLLWTALGVAALGDLRVADARSALAQGCLQLSHGGSPAFSARALAWRSVAEALHGDLLTAEQLIADPLSKASRDADPSAARVSRLAAALLRLARDETAIAGRLLDEPSDDSPRDPGDRVAAFLSTVVRSRLALSRGDPAAARRLVSKLRYESALPRTGLTSLDADVALGEGDPARARLTLARAQASEDAASHPQPAHSQPAHSQLAHPQPAHSQPAHSQLAHSQLAHPQLALSWARVLLAEGDWEASLAKAEAHLAVAPDQVSLRDRISALLISAIAHRKLGHGEVAADQLGHALALAEPHGHYRPFLDGGQAARSALTVLVRPTSQGAAVAARILQRFETRPTRSAQAQPAVPLTGSELAVLRFLPSHMTNQEIAEALFLSINTVKTHLRSVYRKLGVTTRRQAISAAGRLGLL